MGHVLYTTYSRFWKKLLSVNLTYISIYKAESVVNENIAIKKNYNEVKNEICNYTLASYDIMLNVDYK